MTSDQVPATIDSLTFTLVSKCINLGDTKTKGTLQLNVNTILTNYLEQFRPFSGNKLTQSQWFETLTPLVMEINSAIAFSLKHADELTLSKHPAYYHNGFWDKIRPLCDTFFVKQLQLEITDIPSNPFTDKVGDWNCV